MSHKKAKQKRREEKQATAEAEKGPELAGQITIDVYKDLNVNVRNFPTDHGIAMMVLCNAMMKVSDYFVQQSINNKSNIVLAKPGASLVDIQKMAKGN